LISTGTNSWGRSPSFPIAKRNGVAYHGVPILLVFIVTTMKGGRQEGPGLIPMHTMSAQQRQDPPPYAYNPLSTPAQSPPTSPLLTGGGKTVLVPPPPTANTTSASPTGRSNEPLLPPALERSGSRDAHDELLAKDTRFAELILAHIIIPRIRRDILKCRDHQSLEYVERTDQDVSPRTSPQSTK